MNSRYYIAIDLKSFYASVECVDRGLDPLDANLVVADPSRTDKTICLAVSPSLKSYGIPGRPRLFEVVQKMQQLNQARQSLAPDRVFRSKSFYNSRLQRDASLKADYIVAPPRMSRYMAYSTRIYQIYLRFVAPEDIYVYSVDEVFIDATPYLQACHTTPHNMAMRMIREVLSETGITATAGIGTNLFLCKVAMDIAAKHSPPDRDGVRIAELNEESYRRLLWGHRPITDFWRVGRGTARRLETMGLYTMGDVARFSMYNESALYKAFGINAELLIDHAWGYEPCTMADIKAYRPATQSISSGQVLDCASDYTRTRLIVWEMADLLALDLVRKRLVTDQLVLTVGYDVENLLRKDIRDGYHGEITTDYYGRKVPKHAHGTISLAGYTSSGVKITEHILELFDRIIDRHLLVRRINLCAGRVLSEEEAERQQPCKQLDFFTDAARLAAEDEALRREHSLQTAVLRIKQKYGKNAILKGSNYCEGGTARLRNQQVGGHRA